MEIWLAIILAITIMYLISQICDVFKEWFKKEKGVKYENTEDIKKE